MENNDGGLLMRKYIIGAAVGFCLSLGVGAHAEVSSFVGRAIEGAFPVTYNASPIGDGLVVDGTTYLPVRKLGEALGLTVSFDADLGVSLTKSVTGTTYSTPQEVKPVVTTPAKTEPIKPVLTVEQLDEKIKLAKANIWSMKAVTETDGTKNPNYQTYKDRLTKYEAELADLERQKAALQP